MAHQHDPTGSRQNPFLTNGVRGNYVQSGRPLLVVSSSSSSPIPDHSNAHIEMYEDMYDENHDQTDPNHRRSVVDVPSSPQPGGSEVSRWYKTGPSSAARYQQGNHNASYADQEEEASGYFNHRPPQPQMTESRPYVNGPMNRRASTVSNQTSTPQQPQMASFGSGTPMKPSPLGGARRTPMSRPTSGFNMDSRYCSAPIPIIPPKVADRMNRQSRTNTSFSVMPSHQTSAPVLRSASVSTPQAIQSGGEQPMYNALRIQDNTPRIHSSTGFRPALQPIMQTPTTSEHESVTLDMDVDRQVDQESGSRRPSPPQYSSITNSLSSLYGRFRFNGNGERTEDGTEKRQGSVDSNATLHTFHGRDNGMAAILGFHDEPMEPDDPRLTGVRRKSIEHTRPFLARRTMSTSQSGSFQDLNDIGSIRGRSRSFGSLVYPIKNHKVFNGGLLGKKEYGYHSSMESHVDRRRKFILKMAKALMLFGAPSHRVESQLNAMAGVLHLDAQFIHFPGIVIVSFSNDNGNMSQCHFVKSKTEIALGRLNELHALYKEVLSDKIPIAEASDQLDEMFSKPPEWSTISRILFSIIKCGMMAPINFGGSFVDIWISALFGGLLTFSQLCLAGNNQMFSNVFDIFVAILFSFVSRALSVKSVFCYEAIASSGLIGLLPGYAVLCASLELASKNMMSGSVRMVYAVIYSLFLGFAISIGSDLYYWVDPSARRDLLPSLADQMQVMGSFILSNETMPHWTGSFTFTNATASSLRQTAGQIGCIREPDWPWWRQSVPPVSKAATVPIFSFLSCLSFLLPLKTKEVPVSVLIACIGYAANTLAGKYIFDRSDVVSAIGSFVIGILGNAYSRIYNATAFTAITVAVNFLVPSGMALAGGLAMTYKGSDGDLYTNGLSLGFRMVQVSIGITTGLFISAILVHMLGNKRSNAVLFAF